MDAIAVVDLDVMEGRVPVLLVVHYSGDESWAFLSGGDFDAERSVMVSISGRGCARPLNAISSADTRWEQESAGVWIRAR